MKLQSALIIASFLTAVALAWHYRKRMTVKAKVATLALTIGIGSVTAIGLLAISQSRKELMIAQEHALEALAASRAHHIEKYFAHIREQMFNFAQNHTVTAATAAFSKAFQTVPEQLKNTAEPGSAEYVAVESYFDDEFRTRLADAGQPARPAQAYMPASASGRVLQAMYIANNPNEVGSKHLLDASPELCDYNKLHAQYHPQVRRFLESFGYYDIFLFDLDGNLIYSVFKETDYGTNFLTGPYKETNFGDVYRQARAAEEPGTRDPQGLQAV